MKIVAVKSFSYPTEMTKLWEQRSFQPKQDQKVKIELDDGVQIEAAVFKLTQNDKEEFHACVSTQAGCKFGCHFCSSGTNGFSRNLTAAEIVGEIDLLSEIVNVSKFDQIVYMGIGEPLDNLKSVADSIKMLINDAWYFKRISMATIGIIPHLKQLSLMNLPLKMLWISLHAPNDVKRVKLMPINKLYQVRNLVQSANEFSQTSGTGTWLNYMIFKGFNDSIDDARELTDMLNNIGQNLSVMITIPNGKVSGYVSGDMNDVYRFIAHLTKSGMKNRIDPFYAAGRSVNAGCGEFLFFRK